MSPASPLAALRPPRLLLNLLLVGAFLRLAGLGGWSLWLDEGATWSAAARGTWSQTLLAEANHPPLWWLLTRAWIEAFGDSELMLRAPAALLSIAAIWLTWCVMLRVLDPAHVPRRGGFSRDPDGGRGRSIAAWTAGLVAVSAYFVEYAQEARMYPLLLVEALGLTLLYLRWLDRSTRPVLIAYALLATLALYTHYFGVWILGAHALHALWIARRGGPTDPVRPAPLLLAVATAALLFAPWFVYLLTHYQGIARTRPEPFSHLLYIAWRVGAGPGLLASDPAREAQGIWVTVREAWPVVAATALLWLVPLLRGVLALARRPGLRGLVVCTLGVPVAGVLAAYPFFALLHERYALFVAPWIVLLAVLGAFASGPWLRGLMLVGLSVLAVGGTVAYVGADVGLRDDGGRAGELDGVPIPVRRVPDLAAPFDALVQGHPYQREPWRQAHAFVTRLGERAEDRGLVLLHAWYLDLVWAYYDAHPQGGRTALPVLPLPGEPLGAEEVLARWRETLAGRRRLFLVLSHEETTDPDHWIRAVRGALGRLWLSEGAAGLQQIGPVSFPQGVRVVVFARP